MTAPNLYEEKQERRRERLLERADKADAEGDESVFRPLRALRP